MDGNDTNCEDTDPEYVPDVEEKNLADAEDQTSGLPKRKGKPRVIWNFFKRVPPVTDKLARCTFCDQIKSYRTSLTNLRSHLKMHPKVWEKFKELSKMSFAEKTAEMETDYDDNSLPEYKPRERNPTIWKYFEKIPESDKMAKCNVCDQVRSYRSSITNLKTHLSGKHPDVIDKDHRLVRRMLSGNASGNMNCDDRDEDDDSGDDEMNKNLSKETLKNPQYRGRSSIWRHFTLIKPAFLKRARCNHCHQEKSFRSTITNLKMHLVNKHVAAVQKDVDISSKTYQINKNKTKARRKYAERKSNMWEFLETDTDKSDNGDEIAQNNTNDTVKFSSEIWRHFDVEDDEALCGLCRDSITSSLEDMKNHLEEKHSDVFDSITQKVLEAASEDENMLGDDMYTEVVYLDEEPEKTSKPEKSNKKLKLQSKAVKRERKASTSSDEVVSNVKRTKHNDESNKNEPDELESFLNYIKVLLKKVPEESSQNLHLDIINLIMNATQKKIVIETLNINTDNGNINNFTTVPTVMEKNTLLSQNKNNTSDNTINVQRLLTLTPLQNLRTQSDEKNTIVTITTNSNDPRSNCVTKSPIPLPELRIFNASENTR